MTIPHKYYPTVFGLLALVVVLFFWKPDLFGICLQDEFSYNCAAPYGYIAGQILPFAIAFVVLSVVSLSILSKVTFDRWVVLSVFYWIFVLVFLLSKPFYLDRDIFFLEEDVFGWYLALVYGALSLIVLLTSEFYELTTRD